MSITTSKAVAGLLAGLCLATAPAAEPEPPSSQVRVLAVLLQIAGSLEESVTSGELGQVHNEDILLYAALSRLKAEAPTDVRQDIDRLIPVLGRAVADLHAAADAEDRESSQAKLMPALMAFGDVVSLHGEQAVAAARQLAARYTCPMHPDVVGKKDEACGKCGMAQEVRARVTLQDLPLSAERPSTVSARIRSEGALGKGEDLRAVLVLRDLRDQPLLPKDLREVHTKKIHLLVIDPTLTDYHHVHPEPTGVPGEYAFQFTPRTKGPYRAWADVQPLLTGFQEYAWTDIASPRSKGGAVKKTLPRTGERDRLRAELEIPGRDVRVAEPAAARVHITREGKPFTALEPLMGAFAHLVGFHEDWKTVLHMHPIESRVLRSEDRGGPDLDFRIWADTPGYYRLFLQVQVGGESKFIPFGIEVLGR